MLVATLPRNRIEEVLEARGKSIYWLAKAIGMSYNAVYSLVKSPEIPRGTSYGTLMKISDALGVGIEELENGTGDKQ